MQYGKDYALNFDQQGDVLLYKIAKIPTGVKKLESKNGLYTFAEGEATGHHHSVVADDEIELYEKDGILYCCNNSTENKQLTHQEHKPIFIEPGIFEIGKVREVDPFTQEIRSVLD